MFPTDFLLMTNYVCALFMTGLIWFIQVVHYPLFHEVPESNFNEYEHSHRWRTSSVVLPVMLTELVTSFFLLWAYSKGHNRSILLAGALLVIVIWCSTIFLQMPLHFNLESSKKTSHIDRLISTNWIRTLSWTVRSILLSTIVITW